MTALYPGKDPVPTLQEAGWAPGPVWTGAENLVPHRDSILNRPDRSQSLYRLSYPAHIYNYWVSKFKRGIATAGRVEFLVAVVKISVLLAIPIRNFLTLQPEF